MKRPIPQGLLVAVEGIDGAGKTSIATHLAQWCGERGLGCTISKEPTGLMFGTQLRNESRGGRLTIEKELELFDMDRRHHVARCIRPSLAEGNIVLLDRYYWSSAAYQGSRGANYLDIMAANERFAPKPDLVLVLDVDVDAGLQRIRMRGDQPNAFETKASLSRARQIFLQLTEQNSNACLVDASGHIRQTFENVLRHFQAAALQKISTSGGRHSEMVNRTLIFFGGEEVAFESLTGTPELDAVLADAQKIAAG